MCLQNCVYWSATYGPLYCTNVKVGLLVREWNRNWKLQKCGFYGVCCVLHGLTKCQMKKYFKEPTHQEISWRLLLTDKSDLWDTSWERVSWKRSHWPGWLKAKELEVDKGKRLWTGCHSLVGNNGRSMTYWKSVKIVMNILIANIRVWHGTYIGLCLCVYLLIFTKYTKHNMTAQ